MKATKRINPHSSVNQKIIGDFVAKEVFCNMNEEIEILLDDGQAFKLDDITNFYVYPEYIEKYANFEGGTEEAKENEINRLQLLIDQNNNKIELLEDETKIEKLENENSIIEDEIQDLNDLESEPQEIFEWWAVSNWLGEKLGAKGEPVITNCFGKTYWGRTCTGQAILLDAVICEIANDIDILK